MNSKRDKDRREKFYKTLAFQLHRLKGIDQKKCNEFSQTVAQRSKLGVKLYRSVDQVTRVSGTEYRDMLGKLSNHSRKCEGYLHEIGPALRIIFGIEFMQEWSMTRSENMSVLFGLRQPPENAMSTLDTKSITKYSEVIVLNLAASLNGLQLIAEKMSALPVPGKPGQSIRQSTSRDISIVEIRFLANQYREILGTQPSRNRTGVFHAIVSAYLTFVRKSPIKDCYPMIKEALDNPD